MPLTKGNFYLACHGLIRKGNRYLITKRNPKKNFMAGYWDVPGGTIEFEEKLEQGLIREIKEETSLKVKPIRIISAFTSSSKKYNHQVTQLTYLCDYISGEVKLNAREHVEYKWVNKKEMKNYKLIHFVKDLIKKF
jgi:8-oxo-dGTP diphosphatase